MRRALLAAIVVGISIWMPALDAQSQPQVEGAAAETARGRPVSQLNVSIAVFEPGVPDDPLEQRRLRVDANIREIEAILLPFMLRQVLVESDEWGAVRVLPTPDHAAELLVTGEIVRADGEALELRVRAVDAGGTEWIDKVYASAPAADISQRVDRVDLYGYQALFESIAEDLRDARNLLDEKMLSDVIDVSFLRYAYELAPTVFDGYVENTADDRYVIRRLPAEDDPMSERIERVRDVEYRLIDTVDEKFQELHAEISAIYDLWLDYRRQVANYQNSEVERVQASAITAPSGSYEAIRTLYDNYKWARMQEQRRDSRAQAFSNEVGPTVERIESRVAELEQWLVQQYDEWRGLLADIFALETGLAN